MHDVLAGAPERALVAVVDAALLRLDVHGGLFVRVQQPLPVLLPEPAPRPVDVDPQAADDAAQVGALPGTRPGGDRPLADAQRGVRDEQVLGDVVHDTQAVALRAGAGRGVGRERLGLQPCGPGRIGAGAGVQHAQQIGQRGEGADRRARAGRAAPLLQGHGRWQSGDLPHVRCADLLQQPAGVRCHGLEVAPLGLRVERAERERGLARTGDAGEGDHGVPRHVHVDVPQVVLTGAPYAHEGVAHVLVHHH